MKIFKLPDLGEGLPEATIREWLIKEGDIVTIDQPMVSVETAKALVEVPAPYSGTIEKLFAQADETIQTGAPLVGFHAETTTKDNSSTSNTVVGNLEITDEVITHMPPTLTERSTASPATPTARALARKLNIELTQVAHQGDHITKADVQAFASQHTPTATPPEGMKPLPTQRKAMALAMARSQQQVALTTIFDEADISAWSDNSNMTVRIIKALSKACEQEPILNSHFDADTMCYRQFDTLHLGLAIDTANGLFVPVIKNANTIDDHQLLKTISTFKEQARTHSIAQDDLHGATLTLSNFGTIAGRFATPMISPPEVAIIGIGKAGYNVKLDDGNLINQRQLPISLSFDHRLATGGEAARFLHAMIHMLEQQN